MKIVYIGASDGLAETVIERMSQEGNDVYLLSDNALSDAPKKGPLHRYYRSPRKGQTFENLLRSLSPDCVIFAGKQSMGDDKGEDADQDIMLLARSLRALDASPHTRFVLLSSTDVYGNTEGAARESAPCLPATERGLRFVQEEQLLEMHQQQRGLDGVILRISQLYTDKPEEGHVDFLSRSFTDAIEAKSPLTADVFQPLHVADLADAIKRVMDAGEGVYNVAGGGLLHSRHLHELVCQEEKLPERPVQWLNPPCVSLGDDSRIEHELGWREMRNLEELMQQGKITYRRARKKRSSEKKRIVPTAVRQTAENLLIFAAFFALDLLCGSHELFSQINWLMIYVILVSVSYNIYQSTLAAILASAAYLLGHIFSVAELNTFNFYAESVLAIAEFVFLGLIVSYTTNTLRGKARDSRLDLELLQEEYDDLKVINDENVLIKNEYEQRVLTSKSGFPKLYDLVSRLMVQEPDRILMETMQVISELVSTDTVAVYQGEAGTPYLRLVGALSDDSALGGKTWDLSESPRIRDAIERGELYQGQLGSDEPAVVMPIICHDVPEVVVLIKRLPYESETLYHINLLKTMSLLLRDSMEKALQYEKLSREDAYVAGTDILLPEAFRKRIQLAEEKAQKGLAEYCVVRFSSAGSLAEATNAISQTLRATDQLGTDDDGALFALLNNTGPDGLSYLQKRLSAYGVRAQMVLSESMAV